MFVPVKSKDGEQLMPTSPPVVRHLIKSGKATPYGIMVSSVFD